MISNTERYLFDEATRLAEFGEHRVRVGAIAATGRTKVAGAFNTSRNRSPVDYTAITYHAEHNLLRMLPYNLRQRSTVYISRIDTDGRVCDSKPCPRCMKKLKRAGIARIVYYSEGKLVRAKI